MGHRIVILGGGTGGTLTANRLRRTFSDSEAEIIVVDQDDRPARAARAVPVSLASRRRGDPRR